jgi:hypothetical protein
VLLGAAEEECACEPKPGYLAPVLHSLDMMDKTLEMNGVDTGDILIVHNIGQERCPLATLRAHLEASIACCKQKIIFFGSYSTLGERIMGRRGGPTHPPRGGGSLLPGGTHPPPSGGGGSLLQ